MGLPREWMKGRVGIRGALLAAVALLGLSAVPPGPSRATPATHLSLVIKGGACSGEAAERHRVVALEVWVPEDGNAGRLPLLLYAPGWGSPVRANAKLLATLAGQGFVVVGIDRAQAPEGSFDFSSAQAAARTYDLGERLVAEGAGEASFVLDSLTGPGSSQWPPELLSRIDPGRVGILGYSFGGAIAAEASRRDGRFGAVLNLDGWLFGRAASEGFSAPYMLFIATLDPPSRAELEAEDPTTRYMARQTDPDSRNQRRILADHGGYSVEIARAKHASFTDVPWYLRLLWTVSGHPSRLTAEVVTHFTGAFFLTHLAGSADEVMQAAHPFGAEVRFTIWPRGGPAAPPSTARNAAVPGGLPVSDHAC